MVKTPCQQIVWDVLPAIRSALAVELVRSGVAQQDVARILEIGPPAVSQYLSRKRGYRIEFEEPIARKIEELAHDLRDGTVKDVTARICAICHEMRDNPPETCGPVKESGP